MTVPFALSVHNFIKNVGADAGFASIIGLAFLVLLYFAQMRETATLRDRLEEAMGRVGELENRIAHMLRAQSVAPRATQPPVAPRPSVPLRPMGSALASVRPSPANAVAAGVMSRPVPVLPGAPAGVGAPALAAATKLIPTPVVMAPATAAADLLAGEHEPAVDDTVLTIGASRGLAAGNGHASVAPPPFVPPPVGAAVSAPGAGGFAGDEADRPPYAYEGGEDPLSAPPRARIGQEPPLPPRRTFAGSRLDDEPRRSPVLRILFGLVALVIVAGVVVGLLYATGGSTTSGATHTDTRTKPSTRGARHHSQPPVFNAADVTVAVLNGTAVNGLAKDVADELANHGFKEGAITNAAVQTQTTTVVGYLPGGNADAAEVAKSLKLSRTAVQPAGQSAIVACAAATTPAGAATTSTSCPANVIVTVGADLTSAGTTS